jgi:hypothetical protein
MQIGQLMRSTGRDIQSARALVLGGTAFAIPEAVRAGIDILRRELPRVVLQDGGVVSREAREHADVLLSLVEVQAVSPHTWLAGAIERMQTFVEGMSRPDGTQAFGEGAAGRSFDSVPPLAVFPTSGFVVARCGGLWLAFCCAPVARALAVEIWWEGRQVVAGSTFIVDERTASPKTVLRYAREQAVEASAVLPGRLRHIRRIEWSDDEVVVHDRVDGKGRHRIDSRLVLAEASPEYELHLFGVEEAVLPDDPGSGTNAVVGTFELPAEVGFRMWFGQR